MMTIMTMIVVTTEIAVDDNYDDYMITMMTMMTTMTMIIVTTVIAVPSPAQVAGIYFEVSAIHQNFPCGGDDDNDDDDWKGDDDRDEIMMNMWRRKEMGTKMKIMYFSINMKSAK